MAEKALSSSSDDLNPRMHLLYAQPGFLFSVSCAFYRRALDSAPCRWSQPIRNGSL